MHTAAAHAGHNPDNCHLILPIFYTDSFGHQQTWPESIDTIYMCLANLSKEDHKRTFTKHILCYMPKGVDLLKALTTVIIKPMLKLKQGIKFYFKADQASHWCYSLMFVMMGDHPSQAKLAGTCQCCLLKYW
jgi:hypothetical protein